MTQSAWSILRTASKDDPLRTWGEAIAKRRGKRIAAIALARRLAGVLCAMWRDGTVYDAEFAARSGVRGLRSAAQRTELRAVALERAAAKFRTHRTKPSKAIEVNIPTGQRKTRTSKASELTA